MASEILTSAVSALAPAIPVMLDAAIKGALIILVAAVVTLLLRRRSAAARHATWTTSLVAQLLLPVLAVLMPAWGRPVAVAPAWLVPAASAPAVSRSAEGTALRPAGVPGSKSAKPAVPTDHATRPEVKVSPSPTLPAVSTPVTGDSVASNSTLVAAESASDSRSLLLWLGGLWAVGALMVLARLAAGTVGVARLARRGELVDDGAWLSLTQRLARGLGVARPTTLLRGGGVGVPVTWGVVYPVVLLPDDAADWPEERRRYVLVHELAHVKRLDAFTQLVAQIVVALFWFNPLVWLAAHRMRVEREHACDDYVLREGTTPSRYAHDLLELVRQLGTPTHASIPSAFAALAMARRSEFEGRMLSILDPVQDRHTLSRKTLAMSLALAALLVLPLAGFHPLQQRETRTTVVTRGVGGLPPITVTTVERSGPQGGTRVVTADSANSAKVISETVSGPATTEKESCDRWQTARMRGTSRHIHSNTDDNDWNQMDYVAHETARCAEAHVTGPVMFTADDTDVASLGPSGFIMLRERTDNADRRVVVREWEGKIEHAYSVDGSRASFDDGARGWYGRMLKEIVRELSIDAPKRIKRLHARGGVQAVLTDIDSTRSGGAKSTAYKTLLSIPALTSGDKEQVLRAVTKETTMSSGDLSGVMRGLKGVPVVSAATRSAVEDGLDRISSSGDRKETLLALAPSADKELLLILVRSASRLPSSGDKSGFLSQTAATYLSRGDSALRRAFFSAVATLPSSGDHSRVLMDIMDHGRDDASVVADILHSVKGIASAGDKSRVLVQVASEDLITTRALRDKYLEAARTISSSGDYRRVMEALLGDGSRF
ncbi:MAG: hypothetical protein H7Z74_15100 [Anaerolineae bacterium]|nr:hypothetical protein [Gemmatimonadaceae bacterium]